MNNLDAFINEIGRIGFSLSESDGKNTMDYVILPDKATPRWMIPVCKGVKKSNALLLYIPSSLKGKSYKKAVSILPDFLCKLIYYRNLVSLEINDSWIKSSYEIKEPSYSFYIGNGGPHAKAAIQISEKDKPVLYVKAARSNTIKGLFENEIQILSLLNKSGLGPYIPGYVNLSSRQDVYLLAVSTEKTIESDIRFSLSELHVGFLKKLYEISQGDSLSDDSLSYYTRSASYLARFISQNPKCGWLQKLYQAAIEKIRSSGLRTCICHRDFTPWNIYFNADKINVFDWEYACVNYMPFFDILHFIIQKALLTGKTNVHRLLRDIQTNPYVKEYSRQISATEDCINAFCVLYLLDILFLYEFRSGSMDRSDTLLKNKRLELLGLLKEGII